MIDLSNFRFDPLNLPKEAEEVFYYSMKEEVLPKGHSLLKEGQVCHRLYFLEKGTARSFYHHDGKDITSWIYKEDFPFTSWYSFLQRQPSFEGLTILEPSIVYSITKDELEGLYDKYPVIERFCRKMIEQQLAYLDAFYKGFMFMSARERYDLLLTIFPEVPQRVNLGYIASLLGISQETLSRIRGRKNN